MLASIRKRIREYILGQLLIDPFEALVSFLCPFERLYPLIFASDLIETASVVGNWSYQDTEVPDEPPREGLESTETPYVCYTLGSQPPFIFSSSATYADRKPQQRLG